MHLRCLVLVCLAVFGLERTSAAQTISFDAPLSVTKIELPLHHPPEDLVCTDNTGNVTEQRFWQKDPARDGFVEPKLRPGQMVPPCKTVTFPKNPPLFVTCSTYAGFTVKEQQFEGNEGDDDIAIVPKQRGQDGKPCDDRVAPGQVSLKTAMSSEAFMGVVSHYVFVAAVDGDGFGWHGVNIFRTNWPKPIALLSLSWNDRSIGLTHVPNGFDLRFMNDASLGCGVDGVQGGRCLAQLERMTGVELTRAQCLKALPKAYHHSLPQGYPVALEYPVLLTVRGTKAEMRAIGPAVGCVASKY